MSISEKILHRLRRAPGIVSPSLAYLQEEPQPAPALKIAFLGYNTRLTARYLEQLAVDNVEWVRRFERHRSRIILKDGTEIIGIMPGLFDRYPDGHRFDQVILADDWRMMIKEERARALQHLEHILRYSAAPEEYKWQVYDIDAEAPRHGV